MRKRSSCQSLPEKGVASPRNVTRNSASESRFEETEEEKELSEAIEGILKSRVEEQGRNLMLQRLISEDRSMTESFCVKELKTRSTGRLSIRWVSCPVSRNGSDCCSEDETRSVG